MEKTRLVSLKFFCMVALLAVMPLWVGGGMLHAQQSDNGWKNEKITLRISNESLGKVLDRVAKEANVQLNFQNVTLVGINQPTTLNVKDMPLHQVIDQLIGNQEVNVNYEVNRVILITSAKKQQLPDGELMEIGGFVMGDDTKDMLIGASIIITDGTADGGTEGCITDIDGKFSIRVPRKSSIRVSYIGYESQSVQILRPDSQMKIVLSPSTQNIDEVVVTGISKRSKNSFTGNFVTVKGDDLRKLNPNNFLKGLQFYDPSFKVVENNLAGSDPNAVPEFELRGDQTLPTGSGTPSSMDLMLDNVSTRPNTPLFVLDGFIVPMSRILQLDPQRIENVTILKDAAATAIYGSKASNGVIVVETMVAPDGALSVSYNGGLTIQAPDLTDYNMMNAAEKLETELKAGVYDPNSLIQLNKYNERLRNVLAGVDTYWLSQPLRTAFQNRHTLTAAGGTEVFRYSLGINATFSPGVMKGSSNNNKSVDFSMTYRKGRATVGATINLAETDGENSPYGNFSSYTATNPYYEKAAEAVLDNFNGRLITNPLYNATIGIKDFTKNTNIAAGLNLEYRLMENLRITEQLSYTRGMARAEKFLPANHTSFSNIQNLTKRGSYTKSTGESTSWSSNFGVNYNLPVDKHLFSVFGNWMVSEDRSNYVNLSAIGYPDANMDDFIFGNEMVSNMGSIGTEALSRSMSLIGQVSYSYDNRYSADFNISAETSSRYSDHNLSPFWSAGLRWNAHQEKWLEGRISNLVFRATYGITGETGSDPYQAMEFYTYSNTMKPYHSFGVLGATLRGLHNADLKWAKTDNLSLGVDIGFWKNRVNASFNYYNNITRNMLTQYDLAPSTGFASQSINAGELQNKGFDATLNVIAYQNIKKQMNWTLSAGINHNKNKIRKLSAFLRQINNEMLANASNGAPVPELQEGTSTTTLYLVRSLGIDPVTGKEVFLTRDGKKTFEHRVEDKVAVGDTNPDASGTVSSSFTWKDFSCMLGFTYRWGGVVYNQTLVDKIENRSIGDNQDRRAMTDRWQQPGDITYFKALATGSAQTPQSTRFLMDDNEFKLASLNLGYRFQDEKFAFLRRMNIDVLSLNFTTNDLFRISSVKMERGLSYPFARSYTLSLSILFK